MSSGETLSTAIVAKALELGADLAGLADVGAVVTAPSYRMIAKMDAYGGVGSPDDFAVESGVVDWPREKASVLVFAVGHPADEPDLDWWRSGYPGGTEGNRRLIEVQTSLGMWLREEHGVDSTALPYYVESGGVFLKDAAALAGLGRVGSNNLLITPEFGPRVRLRAMVVHSVLSATGPTSFDPCSGCPAPCRDACPQTAMSHGTYSEDEYGQPDLPGRDGMFDRLRCNVQMEADESAHEPVEAGAPGGSGMLVRYCRRCEFACVVG